ncbi:odorant receptor 49b-like [Cylas formicarius]|uniref:odorant receptor 49b-like n=1 Tax=Cylas formicarius TaxID=197179 RepID=UPI002958DE9F|nr:odorant receptor 49b-like [Cylas formicarius]
MAACVDYRKSQVTKIIRSVLRIRQTVFHDIRDMCFRGVRADLDNQNSTSRMLNQLSFVIPMLTVLYAMLVCGTDNFRRVISYITEEETHLSTCDDEEILKLHSRHLRIGKFVSTILVFTVASTGTAIVLENLYRNLPTLKRSSGGNDTIEVDTIFDVYYFGIDKSKHAVAFVLVNEIVCVFNTTLTLAVKSIMLTCMIFAAFALSALRIRFRKVDAKEDVGLSLKHLIVQHQRVIGYVDDLNDLVKHIILFEYVFESLTVAAVSVQLATCEPKLMPPTASYLCYLLLQILMLGWTTNEIKVQSLALSDGLYESPWYRQNESSKRVLLVMTRLTQKPLTLTIGPFGAMTMQSALAVIKGSYSYVTLMKNNYK